MPTRAPCLEQTSSGQQPRRFPCGRQSQRRQGRAERTSAVRSRWSRGSDQRVRRAAPRPLRGWLRSIVDHGHGIGAEPSGYARPQAACRRLHGPDRVPQSAPDSAPLEAGAQQQGCLGQGGLHDRYLPFAEDICQGSGQDPARARRPFVRSTIFRRVFGRSTIFRAGSQRRPAGPPARSAIGTTTHRPTPPPGPRLEPAAARRLDCRLAPSGVRERSSVVER